MQWFEQGAFSISTKQEKHNKLGRVFLKKKVQECWIPAHLPSQQHLPSCCSESSVHQLVHRELLGKAVSRVVPSWRRCCLISNYLLLSVIRERGASQWSPTQWDVTELTGLTLSAVTSPSMVLHNWKAHPTSLSRCTGDPELMGLGKVLFSFSVTQFMPCPPFKDLAVIQKWKHFDVCVLH